jgi:two-component system response regulator AdeR
VAREILNDGRPSVLVIEDDADNRELLVYTVGEVGFRYLEAADGPTALSLLTLYKPAAIILDMNIPVLDGFALLKAVRSNEAMASIPVLVVSGMARPEDISRARALGIAEYILKPWSPSDLEVRLVRAIKGASEMAALKAA